MRVEVLSADLVPLIEPAIERWGLEGFAKTVAASTGFARNYEAIVRRLFELRSGRAVTCDVARADEYLLACDDFVSLAQLPHFPGNRRAARLMVSEYHASRGTTVSSGEADRLAESLIRFTHGLKHEAIEASEPAQAARRQYLAQTARRRRKAKKQALAA